MSTGRSSGSAPGSSYGRSDSTPCRVDWPCSGTTTRPPSTNASRRPARSPRTGAGTEPAGSPLARPAPTPVSGSASQRVADRRSERAHRGGQQGRRDPVDAQGAGEGRCRVLQRAGPAGGALGHAAGGAQLLLVPRALPGAVDRDTGGTGAVRPRLHHRAHHHREPAGGRDQPRARPRRTGPHVQQGRQVRLPVDAATHRQQVLQRRPTHHVRALAAQPAQHRAVGVEHPAVAGPGPAAAGRVAPAIVRTAPRSRPGTP